MKKAAVILVILALFFCTSCRQQGYSFKDSEAIELFRTETEQSKTFAKDVTYAYLVTTTVPFRGIQLTSTVDQSVSFLFDIYTYSESYDNTLKNGKAVLSDEITTDAKKGNMSLFFDAFEAGTYLIVLKAQADFATVVSVPSDGVSIFENGQPAVTAPTLTLWGE